MKVCPSCQKQFPDQYSFCQQDGLRLEPLDVANQPTVAIERPQFTTPATQPVARAVPLDATQRAPFTPPTAAAESAPTRPATTTGQANATPTNPIPSAEPTSKSDPYATRVAAPSSFPLTEAVPPPQAPTAAAPLLWEPPPPASAAPRFTEPARNYAPPTPAVAPAPAVVPPVDATLAVPAARTGLPGWLKASLLLLVLFGLLGAAIAYYVQRAESPQRRYEAALKRGDFVMPSGASAFDLYQQLKREGANQEQLLAQARPSLDRLVAKPQQLFRNVAVPGQRDGSAEDWDEAMRLLTFAQELKPKDPQLQAQLNYAAGRAAYLRNRKDDAITFWKRAADLDKAWFLPLNSLGVIYNEQKNPDAAIYALTQALKRNTESALPYNNLGTAYQLKKDDAKATEYYQQAIERAPEWSRPHAWLGDIAMRRQDYATAVQEYEKVLGLDATTETTVDIARIKKRLDEARKLRDQHSTAPATTEPAAPPSVP